MTVNRGETAYWPPNCKAAAVIEGDAFAMTSAVQTTSAYLPAVGAVAEIETMPPLPAVTVVAVTTAVHEPDDGEGTWNSCQRY